MGDDQPISQVPLPLSGRQFAGERKVRLGDVTPGGLLRFDALTRYTQDVSDDDTTDAGLADEPGWVVRRTVVDALCRAELGETLRFVTFCSGLGGRWAERRLHVVGDRGARYEVATLWICVDSGSGRPVRLTDQFVSIYGEAAAGRTVTARLAHAKRPPSSASAAPWPLRAVDFDVLNHVNNAAYWAVVDEFLVGLPAGRPLDRQRAVNQRFVVEYGAGVAPGSSVTICLDRCLDRAGLEPGGVDARLWWVVGDEAVVAASASVRALAPDLYSI